MAERRQGFNSYAKSHIVTWLGSAKTSMPRTGARIEGSREVEFHLAYSKRGKETHAVPARYFVAVEIEEQRKNNTVIQHELAIEERAMQGKV